MKKAQISTHFRRNISVGFVKKMSREGVEEVEAFLKRGGKIKHIESGVSGEKKAYTGTSHLRET